MESFVIQIHRRPAATSGGEVVGMVEAIESGRVRPFTGQTELLALLGLPPLRPPLPTAPSGSLE
jgi:hypothetical protein